MTNINGWIVKASEGGQYLYVELDGTAGQIHIKAEEEGFVVDIWAQNEVCVATTSALYSELEPE